MDKVAADKLTEAAQAVIAAAQLVVQENVGAKFALDERQRILDTYREALDERTRDLDKREATVANREKAAGQIYKVAADRLGVIKGLEKSLADETAARKAATAKARELQAELDKYNEVFGKVAQSLAQKPVVETPKPIPLPCDDDVDHGAAEEAEMRHEAEVSPV